MKTENLVGAAGKATRYGGFAAGIQLIIDSTSQDSMNWGKIIAGATVCAVCIVWSYSHDRNLRE